MSTKWKWPKTVTIRTAKDMYKGSLYAPGADQEGGPACLLGCIYQEFGFDPQPNAAHYRIYKALDRAVCELATFSVRYNREVSLVSTSDHPSNSKATLAKIINRTFELLGYTEDA